MARDKRRRGAPARPTANRSPALQQPPRWQDAWAVGPLLALAALTTFYRLTGQSLWADEGNSVAQAMRTLPEIVRHAALDIHPPLYYVLLHGWTRAFGTTELALRSLSAVAGIAVVGLTWALARALWGYLTATVAALLLAVHPFLVYYAQEVRMYIFVALWATLAAYALSRVILYEGRARVARAPRVPATHPALQLGRWDLLYALSVALGLWTHYTFPVVAAVFAGLYVAWVVSTRRTLPVWPRVVRLLTVNLAAVVLYMPWLPVALTRVRQWPRPQDVLPVPEGLALAWRWFVGGPVTHASLPWSWVWAALLVAALWPWRRPTPQGYRRPHWLAWGMPLLWWAAPVAFLAVMNLFRPAYLKFLIAGLPPFVILLARGMLAPWEATQAARSRWPRWLTTAWAVATCALVLLVQGQGLARYYYDPAVARDNYRFIARYIAETGDPEDGIILNAPGQQDVFRYYYRGPLPVYPLPEERPPNPERLEARLQELVRRHRKLFVLLWATAESDPEGIMERWLNRHAYKALDVWEGNVRFLIYASPRHDQPPAFSASVNAQVGEAIWLREFAIWTPEVVPGEVVQVRLTWEATRPLDRRYKVSLQLLGPGDRLVAQRDTEPVGGDRPTTSWQPGERIEDNYGILVPLATPPGAYRLIAAVYDPDTGQRLPVQQDGDRSDRVELPVQVRVRRPLSPPPAEVLPVQHRTDERWDSLRLLGYDAYRRGYRHAPDQPVPPGDFVHLTLYWQALEKPSGRWRATISLVDAWGNVVASMTDDLAGPDYPTTLWEAKDVVRGEFDLYIPPEVKPGTYGLRIQLWRDDTPVGDPVPLGTVNVGRKEP